MKIALLTGASRGIGAAILKKLLTLNYTVIGTATTSAGAEAITTYIQNDGHGEGVVLNVADFDNIQSVLSHVESKWGAPCVLINNAGITQDNLLVRMKDEQWQLVIDTNLTGVFKLTQACLKGMIKARFGRIVSIGSIVSFSGNPGQVNYCAAKAGVVGFSKALAKEIGSRGITVNVIAPGFIETDMTSGLTEEQKASLINNIPIPRMGKPADIAAAVGFLISDEASYITGETLHVNGGLL